MSKIKAGVIPFYRENGVTKMLFQVSSDPMYGGPDPMISKGSVEDGEDIEFAARREAAEELGLKEQNIIEFDDVYIGNFPQYQLEIFTAKISDPDDFDTPHYETAYTVWLTLDEFYEIGRPDHRIIVAMIHAVIHNE